MARKRYQLIDIEKFKNSLLSRITAAVNDDYLPDVVIPALEEFVRERFERTIRNWEGGEGAFGMASFKTRTEPDAPELKFEVETTRTGATVVAYVESYIWNLLDQGREGRVTKKKEVFVPRESQRTIPGTLDVRNDRTYLDVVHVPKGTYIEGFKPRRWTEIIADEVETEFKRKYPNVEFSFTVKEQNRG